MVRSMYSGVAGMRAHQSRMDVIGNNIANVNTYGFKSSRATFRDMYYQSVRGAAAGTANRGGINPSSIGYGSTLASVDLLMGQSALTSTGNPLDVAIAGEGFLQVMDNDGNIFYTKAGMLDIDSAGNLIDSNGYFVLGTSGNTLGVAPGSNKIQFDIPPVNPKESEFSGTINGRNVTITAQNATNAGNVNFVFAASNSMPIGQKVNAIIDNGSITIQVNANETFADQNELNNLINSAITTANGGVAHPAGNFTLGLSPAFPAGITGAELCGKNFGVIKGSTSTELTPAGPLFGGFKGVSVGDQFSQSGDITYNMTIDNVALANPTITIQAVINGVTYEAQITKSQMSSSGNVVLKNTSGSADPEDTILMSYPEYGTVINAMDDPAGTPTGWASQTVIGGAVASQPAKDIGLGSTNLKLTGGTEGGPQTIKDLVGISIGADGSVNASHADHGLMVIGRIDLATFDNPRGLVQSGNSYFAQTPNSGDPSLAIAGEGGTGALKNSALEMSNVDLSQEFSDMITTQRGFQANSRLITVSDTMLEELINLKR